MAEGAPPSDVSLPPIVKEDLEQIVRKAVMAEKKAQKKPVSTAPVVIKHGSFKANPSGASSQTGPSFGDSISISSPKEEHHNNDVLLEDAYNAQEHGQLEVATKFYRQLLARDPNNKDALFGLATIYQQNGELAQARSLYTKLLFKDPSNQDALNNFLMLVAEESPEGALIEMKKLEAISPDFSPIPAQVGMIYAKMHKPQKAIHSLQRALALSPDNQAYRYNLAILYDKSGNKHQAITLYKALLVADREGIPIPGSVEQIKDRLLFLDAQ